MHFKSDLLPCIKDFVKTSFRDDGHSLHILQGDGDYDTKDIKDFLYSKNIRLQTSAPYSPGQNGVAERTWYTLASRARTALTASHLPKKFWCYAMQYQGHVKNRMPTSANNGIAPLLLWIPTAKLNLHLLHVWGCR
jgi:transposase InsO family protein